MEEYIVSARKYRPANFDTVVGQRALTTTLLNAITTGKLAHAYLFCGPRGVGKTTCARIFAKTINCLNPQANGEACNECESCRAFEQQRSMNIHELDAASNNSVEDIRELIKQVQVPPQIGRYKVFIIDEVHMLSTAAFNAFLKTLEEPPSYVIFILATTEKHKILPTILSRCQVYDFARMTIQGTVDHLAYVAQKEGYDVEPEALNLIAQKADGGMRDALSIFDQMASFTGGHITYQQTLDNLNVLDVEYYFRLVDHFLKGEVEPCLLLFNEIVNKGFDGGNFIAGLASHLRNLLVSRDASTLPLLEVSETVRAQYQDQAARCQPKFLYRAIKLCNDCDQGYRTSRNKRLQVEICLIEAAQLTDDSPGVGLGPTLTLKPIFDKGQQAASQAQQPSQQPTTQTQQAAPSATTQSGPVANTPDSTPAATRPQTTIQQLVQQRTQPRRTVNIKHIGPSLQHPSIRQREEEEERRRRQAEADRQQAETIAQRKTEDLNEDNTKYLWAQFASQLPKQDAALAQRMLAINPTIVDQTTFHIVVNNKMVYDEFIAMRPRIVSHFQQALGNAQIAMTVEQARAEQVVRIFDKGEILKAMKQKNPKFAQLTQDLQLEII